MRADQDDFVGIVDTCLDSLLSGQATLDEILAQYPEKASELRTILEASIVFKNFHGFDAAPEIKSAQKIRLLKKINATPQKIDSSEKTKGVLSFLRSFFNPRMYQLAGSIALALLLFFTTTVGFAFAAKNSIPGDLLYQPKLSIEKAALALSLSDIQDASLHIEYTNRRMDEVEAVIQTNRLAYLATSVERYQEQVEKTIGKIKSTSFDSSIEKARLATQLKVVLESHTILISALATTIPDVYREDIDRVASITQETITKTIDIIDQPVDIPLAPTQTVADQPMASWTPTTSLPGSLPTQAKSTPTVQATPLSSETSPPLILPGASPTPTPTTTLTTAPPKPELPTVVPTRKPTKTPKPTKTAKPTKVPPTRNPHYDG